MGGHAPFFRNSTGIISKSLEKNVGLSTTEWVRPTVRKVNDIDWTPNTMYWLTDPRFYQNHPEAVDLAASYQLRLDFLEQANKTRSYLIPGLAVALGASFGVSEYLRQKQIRRGKNIKTAEPEWLEGRRKAAIDQAREDAAKDEMILANRARYAAMQKK